MSTTPEQYDNLRTGDKFTIEYEVTGIRGGNYDVKAGKTEGLLFYVHNLQDRNAVVTRAPREVKPGDTFYFENDNVLNYMREIRTLVYRDDKGILFEHDRNRHWLAEPYLTRRGKLIYHDFG